ncbi:acylphosphatase [Duganella sp. FT92W]|uniref:acylphosphatase n=1 Tax=Pseudoduganella rivuli TaxID=2666085 RepID=A0A7X2LTA2_9BURK|nr:acylphosphatase [Pseudoduganella rivuli]MRV71777.1 acylphosphatase [Pseudoduganella rivuli]
MAMRIVVAGRVQGVGYRYAFANHATELGLAGWVRNRRDGTVEACVQGAAPAIDQIVAWARKGPSAARVDDVQVTQVDAALPGNGFRIAPTA